MDGGLCPRSRVLASSAASAYQSFGLHYKVLTGLLADGDEPHPYICSSLVENVILKKVRDLEAKERLTMIKTEYRRQSHRNYQMNWNHLNHRIRRNPLRLR